MLVIHIVIAIVSLIWATVTYLKPSATKLRFSYGFTGAVVLTGILLVVLNHAVIVQACTSGLTYLAISLSATFLARKKLLLMQAK